MDDLKDPIEPQEPVDEPKDPIVTTPKAPIGDPAAEKRIRDLMSANDKLRQDKTASLATQAAAQKTNVDLQARLSVLEAERDSQLEAANKSTQDALDAANAHEARAATLDEELAKTKVLAENPELRPFAATILATPKANLEAVIANLKEAAAVTRSSTVEQLKNGYIPPANPSRTSDVVMNAQQLKEYLDPKNLTEAEYKARLDIATKATHQIGRPA